MINESDKEKIDKMMIMPSQFESLLCFGASMNDKQVMLVKKVGPDINLFVSLLVSSMVADPELLKVMLLSVQEAVKEINSPHSISRV